MVRAGLKVQEKRQVVATVSTAAATETDHLVRQNHHGVRRHRDRRDLCRQPCRHPSSCCVDCRVGHPDDSVDWPMPFCLRNRSSTSY